MRQAVRQRAVELGFSLVDQTKIVTAASELARNTLHLRRRRNPAHRGDARGRAPRPASASSKIMALASRTRARDEGRLHDRHGLGLGLSGAKRLSNEFSIDSRPGEGTRVTIVRWR